MNGRLKAKLRGQSGETIAETLIALLISALALTMLAGAIGAAARVVTRSENKMQAYYQANNALATPGLSDDDTDDDTIVNVSPGTGTMAVAKSDGTALALADEASLDIQYTSNNEFSAKPVVAYAKSTEGEG